MQMYESEETFCKKRRDMEIEILFQELFQPIVAKVALSID